ncbi:MAG: deoxyguanosinetriphosphate triphosphohydrolase [Clostridiales bacterium]|nr:deoxyguanosinetriphosphate triphosphohydrolase [Clostridiales bacterium]
MRQDWEEQEERLLSPLAVKSGRSRGRERPEEECPLRSAFQRDRDRIIHCKAFRRLKHKAQVFIAPKSDHFRTRLTHTLEVMQISRTIARALRLNEDLTEAVALGHDLGHTPFGHAGERSLAAIDPSFSHNRQSLRVVDVLERGGEGLNLTWEVRDGILHHSGEGLPQTLEGSVVRLADRIAYVNHDIEDALACGIITPAGLPREAVALLGERRSARINVMVLDVVSQSMDKPEIAMSGPVARAMTELREYLFAQVYNREEALLEEAQVKKVIEGLYAYYSAHREELPAEFLRYPTHQAVCDYIAGMTDVFARSLHRRLFP